MRFSDFTQPASLPPAPEVQRGSIMEGFGFLLVLHLLQFPMAIYSSYLVIGISQLLYVIPAALILRDKGRFETVKGIWTGAGITLLANIACLGIIMDSL